MLNIFIDSNILYQDYFFENKSNKQILEYCKEGLLNLYMSDVVRLELRRQFQREIEDKNKEINRIIKDSARLKIENELLEIPVDKQLDKFDVFYKRLALNDNFKILPYKNDFLPDLVERAIYRKKPFTEEKSELKDAIIWKTYSQYVESNDTVDCILLTNNTSDFCSKQDKSKVHHELEVDSSRFSVINKAFEFIKIHSPILESPENKFQAYINQIDISEKFVLEILSENFERLIEDEIHKEIDNRHPSDLFSDDYFFDGQMVAYGCDILECEDIEYEIINDRALISGIIYANCEVEILQYNSVRDPGEDRYSCVGEKNVTFKLYFNFDLKKDEMCSDFEVTDIEVSDMD
ncbi:PIN domain-containing protein [Sphingobacterium sp.]|uniref:PIN domain-containing protein n=1 Tax=Sphingobacterium sp. TaxID=341027 RepID=UPI00289CE81F|nr:PIN domain-containing protein [Sphingobacterium sp.]